MASEPYAAAVREIRDWLATQQIQDPPKGSHASRIAALLDAYDETARDTRVFRTAYFDVQAVLDRALGTREEDGAGEGIAADVALLASRAERAEAAIERVRTYGEQRLRELQAMVDSQVTDRGKRSVAEALEFTICDIHTLLSYLGSVPSDATFPQYPVTTHAPDEPLPVDAEWNGVKDEEDWRLRVLSYDLDPDALPMPAPPFRSVTAGQIASGYQAAKSAIEADR